MLVAVVGLIVYILITLIPMPPAFQTVIVAVAILVIILLLLRIIGFDMPIPRVRG